MRESFDKLMENIGVWSEMYILCEVMHELTFIWVIAFPSNSIFYLSNRVLAALYTS